MIVTDAVCASVWISSETLGKYKSASSQEYSRAVKQKKEGSGLEETMKHTLNLSLKHRMQDRLNLSAFALGIIGVSRTNLC